MNIAFHSQLKKLLENFPSLCPAVPLQNYVARDWLADPLSERCWTLHIPYRPPLTPLSLLHTLNRCRIPSSATSAFGHPEEDCCSGALDCAPAEGKYGRDPTQEKLAKKIFLFATTGPGLEAFWIIAQRVIGSNASRARTRQVGLLPLAGGRCRKLTPNRGRGTDK
jgi:hypothetical protein